MSIYKVHKTSNYTVMSNQHLRNKALSLKAKGLLSVMFSLPDDWDYSINGIVAICKENNTAIESALKELKLNGYLIVTKKMPNETESGRIEYEYDIYETPQEAQKQGVEKQGVENLPIEIQGVENRVQLNTNKLNTNKLNTEYKEERKKEGKQTTYDEILSEIQPDDLRDLYFEYIKMRKMIKSPMTDRALKMLISKVNELEPNNVENQKKLLETAIINNWKSVYPLKDEKPARANNSNSGNIFLDIAKDEGIL